MLACASDVGGCNGILIVVVCLMVHGDNNSSND